MSLIVTRSGVLLVCSCEKEVYAKEKDECNGNISLWFEMEGGELPEGQRKLE